MPACLRVSVNTLFHLSALELGTGTQPCVMSHRQRVDYVCKKFIFDEQNVHLQHFCKVWVMNEMLPDVLKNISHSNSAMWKNNIKNNGKPLDDWLSAGQKENMKMLCYN
jgi:hypothetical protein